MSDLNTLKLSNLNELRKQTEREVSRAISQLNAATGSAMRQQAYMHKNPDTNGADQLIPVATPNFNASAAEFNAIAEKLTDMQKVQAGTLTVDDFIAKYSIDLTEFSNGLI